MQTGKDIEAEYGIPIVNKRISVTPIALIGGAACKTPEDFATIAVTLDRAAKEVGVNFLGGYSALVSKGMTKADELLIRSIPIALAKTDFVCSSINVGSTKTGINMDAVKLMGEIVRSTAEATKDNQCMGCARCEENCPAEAIHIAGKPMTAEAVVQKLKPNLPLLRINDGGITFSAFNHVRVNRTLCKEINTF